MHGMLSIDNNLIENTIRPAALGRKNYLFCGQGLAVAKAVGDVAPATVQQLLPDDGAGRISLEYLKLQVVVDVASEQGVAVRQPTGEAEGGNTVDRHP